MLKFFDADPGLRNLFDPGSGMKNLDPGYTSRIRKIGKKDCSVDPNPVGSGIFSTQLSTVSIIWNNKLNSMVP
jgi:hypothetical protein